jgi:hypothetical protein
MTDEPFTDDMIAQYLQAQKLQAGIIEHVEEMAKVMAAAGVASQVAKGDSPEYAIGRWCEVLRKRAVELVRESRAKAGDATSDRIGEQKKLAGPK